MPTPERLLLNYYDCSLPYLLCQADALQEALSPRIRDSTFFEVLYHQFTKEDSPKSKGKLTSWGVTCAYLGLGKHITLHTWPEYRVAALDIVSADKKYNLDLERKIAETLMPGEKTDITITGNLLLALGTEVVGSTEGITSSLYTEGDLLGPMKYAAAEAKFTVVGEKVYHTPQGVGAGLVLSESHFIVHNFPEGTVWIDIFTCGKEGDPRKGYNAFIEKIAVTSETHEEYPR